MAPRKVGTTSSTLCVDVSHCLGTILVANNVDLRIECCIMALFIRRVTRTSCAVMCVSTETRKNVTNHRGQSEITIWFRERTCPPHRYWYNYSKISMGPHAISDRCITSNPSCRCLANYLFISTIILPSFGTNTMWVYINKMHVMMYINKPTFCWVKPFMDSIYSWNRVV